MKILIQVYLDTPNKIRTDTTDLGAWDKYGVSEALNTVLPQFNSSSFVMPSEDSNEYRVAYSVDKKYGWEVLISDDSGVYPAIFLYDLDTQQYVASLEGTPKSAQDVADLLKSVIVTKLKPRHVTFSMAALAALGTPAVKDKKTKIALGVIGGALLSWSFYDYWKESKKTETVTEVLPTKKDILFYTSPSCAACRILKPKIDAISAKYDSKILLIDSNTEGGRLAHIEAGITVLPVVVVNDTDGRQLKRWDGGITAIEKELPNILNS